MVFGYFLSSLYDDLLDLCVLGYQISWATGELVTLCLSYFGLGTLSVLYTGQIRTNAIIV
jgi:hypothetical protein